MEGSGKRLELLANFWQIAFSEQALGRRNVRIAAYILVMDRFEWWGILCHFAPGSPAKARTPWL
jgi:hypothetical protein